MNEIQIGKPINESIDPIIRSMNDLTIHDKTSSGRRLITSFSIDEYGLIGRLATLKNKRLFLTNPDSRERISIMCEDDIYLFTYNDGNLKDNNHSETLEGIYTLIQSKISKWREAKIIINNIEIGKIICSISRR